MTATELMIGDWVFNTHNRKPEQVAKIACRLVMLDYNDMYEYDLIEPIPLTYEFLRKIFPNTNDGVYWHGRKGKFEFTMENGANEITVLIEYVHELQHALRLCGIEKEIEL